MPTFQYANPATVHWGPGSVREKLVAELDRLNAKRVFFVTTRSAVADLALAPALEKLLGDRIAARVSIGQHAPVASLVEGVEIARGARADGFVSLGGGSPIDAAKAMAFSLVTGIDLRLSDAQTRGRKASLDGILPHLAVPTTLSVAELSGSAGFSAEGTRAKIGVNAPALRPSAVIYDAELAVRTPLTLWLTTGIRAVDHAVETLFAPGEHPLPDLAAAEGLRRLRKGLRAVKARPDDLSARTDCQLGAWFSYLLPGPAAAGLSHTLGKKIGAPHGIPHGVTSCLLLPHVIRYLTPKAPQAARRVAEALDATDAAEGVAKLIEELGLPQRLREYRLTEAQLGDAAHAVAGPEHPEPELLGILRAAL